MKDAVIAGVLHWFRNGTTPCLFQNVECRRDGIYLICVKCEEYRVLAGIGKFFAAPSSSG